MQQLLLMAFCDPDIFFDEILKFDGKTKRPFCNRNCDALVPPEIKSFLDGSSL